MKQILTYHIKHKTLSNGWVVWDNIKDALEELKTHLMEGNSGDEIEVKIVWMSEEELKKLPEFRGY